MVPLRFAVRSMSRPSGVGVQLHDGDGQAGIIGKGEGAVRLARTSLAAIREAGATAFAS
jgi:hypothetical protein